MNNLVINGIFFGLLILGSSSSAFNFFKFTPITVAPDPETILLNKPVELTCNYVKFQSENVREITWYITADDYKHKVSKIFSEEEVLPTFFDI